MKKIKTEKIGDVTVSLYLENLGYTYKIRAKIIVTIKVIP